MDIFLSLDKASRKLIRTAIYLSELHRNELSVIVDEVVNKGTETELYRSQSKFPRQEPLLLGPFAKNISQNAELASLKQSAVLLIMQMDTRKVVLRPPPHDCCTI